MNALRLNTPKRFGPRLRKRAETKKPLRAVESAERLVRAMKSIKPSLAKYKEKGKSNVQLQQSRRRIGPAVNFTAEWGRDTDMAAHAAG